MQELVATGTPTVVVFVSGRPLATPWIAQHSEAIVEAWLPGEEVVQLYIHDVEADVTRPVSN